MTNTQQELQVIGQQYQAAVSALVYDHLATTLEESLVLLGGEDAPEAPGLIYVIEALTVAVNEIADTLA